MTMADMIISLAIGILSSIIAASIVLVYTRRSDKEKIKRKYSGPVGEYSGYSYTGPEAINIQLDNPVSHATIQYLSENKLLITVKELNNNNQWSGIVAMETENYGSLSWRYEVLNNKPVDIKTHSFGFKRLMCLTIDNKKIVYLIGEEGYGKEILIHKSRSGRSF